MANKNKKGGNVVQMLSPKKFVETKARNLPIYECYVNNDWETAKIANVVVMRRHNNGRITAGIYLVDLLCLGVKDTVFSYNEDETPIKERFLEDSEFGSSFVKIDYHLAHNIIYAGHDYAMDYEIKPNPMFATTKFILEEDNDEIPIIEIETGDENGNPVLVVYQAGQQADVLLKLKKNAGEGNYTYLIQDEETDEDEFDEEDYDEEDGEMTFEDFDDVEIGPYGASRLQTKDLMNPVKLESRSGLEKISLRIEIQMRLLLEDNEEYYYEKGPEFELINKMLDYPESVSPQIIEDFKAAIAELSNTPEEEIHDANAMNKVMTALLDKYPNNVLLTSAFYSQLHLSPDNGLKEKTTAILQSLSGSNPFAVLALALNSLIQSTDEEQYKYIYTGEDIHALFPSVKTFAAAELLMFFLIKVLWHSRREEVQDAVKYYQLVSEINMNNWAQIPVQLVFETLLEKITDGDFLDEGDDEDDDIDIEDIDIDKEK